MSDLVQTSQSTTEADLSMTTRISAWLTIAAIVGAIVIVPMLSGTHIRVADSILIYIMLGLGLNIVVGYTGLLDLGYVAFYAVGAYSFALLASPQFDLHLPFLIILPIAMVIGAIAGILLGLPVLRLRGDYLAIVTLGFGEIIRVLINNLDAVTNGPRGLARLDRISMFGFTFTTPKDYFFLLLAATILTAIAAYRLKHSLLGKAWSAIREDQDAARGVGINTTKVKLIAFSVSASIASAAGVFFAGFQRFISPESFTLNESVLIVLLIVIGGVGNILGVIVGALVLILLPELLREFAEYRMLLLGLTMAVVIIVRPGGIVPRNFGIETLLKAVRR
ncbi:ABC transporter permease subunit [Brucella haematophila]|nr:branched-chain amino acid ABC transporter permease [Brucella haematophila]